MLFLSVVNGCGGLTADVPPVPLLLAPPPPSTNYITQVRYQSVADHDHYSHGMTKHGGEGDYSRWSTFVSFMSQYSDNFLCTSWNAVWWIVIILRAWLYYKWIVPWHDTAGSILGFLFLRWCPPAIRVILRSMDREKINHTSRSNNIIDIC